MTNLTHAATRVALGKTIDIIKKMLTKTVIKKLKNLLTEWKNTWLEKI